MSCIICLHPVAAPAPAVCSSRCRSDADLQLRRLAARRRWVSGRISALEGRERGWRRLLRRRPAELVALRQELDQLVPRIEVLLGVALHPAPAARRPADGPAGTGPEDLRNGTTRPRPGDLTHPR
ncbi:MAG: hypothetical protein ACLGIR_09955 [Actinomycetes bacterium]